MRFQRSRTVLLLGAALFAAPDAAGMQKTRPTATVPKVTAAEWSKRIAEQRIPHRKFVLPNGLTLIVNEDRKAPIVAVQTWYHVGSANEYKGRTGFAHLFEHLMFNGSENYNKEFFTALNDMGGSDFNGTTSFDRTNYYQVVPVGALDRMLWLEADRMANLLGAVDQAKLDEQREVVKNEKRQGQLSPTNAVTDMTVRETHPSGHPYTWLPIGSMEDLDAATLDDVRDWFKTWYGAANAVLVVSGDVDADAVRKKVERYFGHIAPGPTLSRQLEWAAPMPSSRRGRVDLDRDDDIIFKIWNVPGRFHADTGRLSVVASAFGSGEDSPLYQRLVVKEKLALEANAGVDALELGSQFAIRVKARKGADLLRIEAIVDEELAKFLQTGPSEQQLDRLRQSTYNGLVRAMQVVSSKATALAESQLYGGSPDRSIDALAQALATSPSQLTATAREWLRHGSYTLEARARPKFAAGAPLVQAQISTMPPLGPPADLEVPPLERFKLANGLTVAIAPKREAPTVSMAMLFDAGLAADRSPTPSSVPAFVSRMFDTGTTTRSAADIRRTSESLSANVSLAMGDEVTIAGLDALAINLEPSLALFADMLIHPIYPAEEFARAKENSLSSLRSREQTASGKVNGVMPRLFYGAEHPYAQDPTPESIGAVDADALRAWRARWMRPENATLLIVGNARMDEIRPMLEKHLGGWKPDGPPATKSAIVDPPATAAPRIFLIDYPNASQSVIEGKVAAPKFSDPDYYAMTVANSVLGAGFLGRMNLNLREDKQWSYGARSGYRADKLMGAFQVNTSVQTDKTTEAMTEIIRELQDFGTTRPPTDGEIKTALDAQTLPLPGYSQTSDHMIGFYSAIIKYGLSDDFWSTYVSRLHALTKEDIARAARRLVRPEAMTWVIAGDLSKIEAPLRSRFPAVSVLDSDGKVLR